MLENGFRETGIVIFNDSVIYKNIGDAFHVEFEFLDFWDKIKDTIKEESSNLYFLHTHSPEFSPYYSRRDELCMKSLYIALGVPINFLIYSFKDNFIFDLDFYRFAHYVYNGTSIQIKNTLPDIKISCQFTLELFKGYS